MSSEESPIPIEPPEIPIVYYQSEKLYVMDGGNVFDVSSMENHPLRSREQVYQRTTKVTEEKTNLEFGWIEKCCLVKVENFAGKNHRIQLSLDQKKEVELQILEIYCGDQLFSEVHPGTSSRFNPPDLSQISYRSKSGSFQIKITIIPE